MKILRKIKSWWQSLTMFVIADPSDNSITLSKGLFNHIKKKIDGSAVAKAFVFSVADEFGFVINPKLESAVLYDIQYNEKHRCIGFETLCPSVGRILYDYRLPADKAVRLSVNTDTTVSRDVIYLIKKPNEKFIREYTKTRFDI